MHCNDFSLVIYRIFRVLQQHGDPVVSLWLLPTILSFLEPLTTYGEFLLLNNATMILMLVGVVVIVQHESYEMLVLYIGTRMVLCRQEFWIQFHLTLSRGLVASLARYENIGFFYLMDKCLNT